MRIAIAMATTLVISTSVPAEADEVGGRTIVVARAGSQPSIKGPTDNFTGSVRVDQLFPATPPSTVSGGLVTFEPRARSAWHTHPLGQTLVITSGLGWVKDWNGQKREMKAGDVVWIPPGVKHWHGASPAAGVSHLAIQQAVDGKNVQWMEKVSDGQYAE